jgi:hypothetical protein
MAEFLAAVSLRETNLGFLRLYPGYRMVTARQFEYLVGLDVQGKVIRKRGMFTVIPSARDQRVVVDTNNIKAKVHHLRCPLQELRMEDALSQPL